MWNQTTNDGALSQVYSNTPIFKLWGGVYPTADRVRFSGAPMRVDSRVTPAC